MPTPNELIAQKIFITSGHSGDYGNLVSKVDLLLTLRVKPDQNNALMAENPLPPPFKPRSVGFPSLRESCLNLLKEAKSSCGRPFPMTPDEMAQRLQQTGLCITARDLEGLLRELCQEGLVQEIDPTAGFRWAA